MQENAFALMKTMAANLATMVTSLAGLPDLTGTWGYTAGSGAGSVALTGSKRVLSVAVYADGGPVTMTIAGGNTISLPAGASIAVEPRGQLTDPTIVLTGPAVYTIEHLT